MDTQLVYRVEHREHRTGPWAYPKSYCYDSFGAEDFSGFPTISYNADRPDWMGQRLWGFRNIAQCLAYFPRFEEAGARHNMILAVYEVERQYVSWDHTQLVFHRNHANRLVDVEPWHLLHIKQMTCGDGKCYRAKRWVN